MARENISTVGPVRIRDAQDLPAGFFDPPESPSDLWITGIWLRPIGRGCHALDPIEGYFALAKPDQEMLVRASRAAISADDT
jgi:hypothetical protein